jgi:hypothetical protein
VPPVTTGGGGGGAGGVVCAVAVAIGKTRTVRATATLNVREMFLSMNVSLGGELRWGGD